jgi:membrane protease YdiL (CAAX protease family)
MLNAWFYSHSIWAVAAAVCFVTTIIPLIGLHFFHKAVPWNVREEDTSMVGLSYALCGGIFAVVLAFVAVGVYEAMDKTTETAGAEANALGNLYNETAGLPADLGVVVRKHIDDYIDTVTKVEWPHQQKYEMDDKNFEKGWAEVRQINTDIAVFEPKTKGEITINADMITLVNQLYGARRSRLLAAQAHLPDAVWQMLIVGLVLVSVFIYLFGPHDYKIHVATCGLTMISIGLIFTLIIALDYPFRGDLSVDDESFLGVQEVGHQTFEALEASEKTEKGAEAAKEPGAAAEHGKPAEHPAAPAPAKKD